MRARFGENRLHFKLCPVVWHVIFTVSFYLLSCLLFLIFLPNKSVFVAIRYSLVTPVIHPIKDHHHDHTQLNLFVHMLFGLGLPASACCAQRIPVILSWL